MRQIFGFWYALLLVGGLSAAALARSNDGAFLILSFDGDALHMAQIVLRMVEGDIPHRDFMTPLGALAFLPMVWLVNLGAGLGAAFSYAPVLLGVFLFPALYWVGVSRFAPAAALAFATLVLVQLTALVHGGVEPTVAVSMYYNNWCWAISAIVVALAVLPGHRPGRFAEVAEPVFIGVGVGMLVLTKITFAVYLLPAVVVGLVLRRAHRVLVLSVVWCSVFLIALSLPLGGLGYWQKYVADLVFVAGSAARAQPGDPLVLMLLSPEHLVGVLALAAGFLFLRQARLSGPSLTFLLLGIGWVCIAHQNWQNDPHWFILAGVLLFAFRQDVVLYNRFGWPLHGAIGAVAIALMVLGLPRLTTQLQSFLVHSGLQAQHFKPVSQDKRLADLRFKGLDTGRYLVATPARELGSTPARATVLNGEVLPDCQRTTGLARSLLETGAALDKIPQTRGKQVLNADWLNGLWLFSDTEPLLHGAPWFYGGAPGLAEADFLVVPLCPMGQGVRRIILDEIAQADVALQEVARTPLFILLQKAE